MPATRMRTMCNTKYGQLILSFQLQCEVFMQRRFFSAYDNAFFCITRVTRPKERWRVHFIPLRRGCYGRHFTSVRCKQTNHLVVWPCPGLFSKRGVQPFLSFLVYTGNPLHPRFTCIIFMQPDQPSSHLVVAFLSCRGCRESAEQPRLGYDPLTPALAR